MGRESSEVWQNVLSPNMEAVFRIANWLSAVNSTEHIQL